MKHLFHTAAFLFLSSFSFTTLSAQDSAVEKHYTRRMVWTAPDTTMITPQISL